MVTIKLETKFTIRINFWIGYTDMRIDVSPRIAKSSLKFLDILRIYIDKLRDLELKVNFTYHLSFPILLTDSRVG